MLKVEIQDAKIDLKQLIKKAGKDYEILFTQGNKPVAKLIIFDQTNLKRKIGSAKGIIKIADDFDNELEDFKGYR